MSNNPDIDKSLDLLLVLTGVFYRSLLSAMVRGTGLSALSLFLNMKSILHAKSK